MSWPAFTTCGQVEAEVAGCRQRRRSSFWRLWGSRPGINRVIDNTYQLLDYVSFLTVVSDEVRAWTVRRKSGGVIHSDLERGLHRAEVVKYDDLMSVGGSMAEARKPQTLAPGGKTYPVQDGDIMHILFNV